MKFTEMNLPEFIVQGLSNQKITEATEIQANTLPLIQSGVDVIGLSQTGSGKTYAYGIPAIIGVDQNIPATQVLIICPTRELVAQVVDDLKKLLADDTRIRIAPIFGGANMDRQIQVLKRGARIVVGTPGRLMDHLRRKTLRLDYLKTVVLDEADEMLQMGFKQDIETILQSTKSERQTIMFSATMPPEIKKLTSAFMRDPVTIKSQNHECQNKLIKQVYINCKRTEKVEMLEKIYEETHPFISIIFCNTKKMTEDLAHSLKKKGLPAVCLHGDMRQRERTRTMEGFKKDGGMLIATDVCARGIDVKNVDIVVNFDFPNNDEYYTHRIGRTGRAGQPGVAFTLINTIQQAKMLQDIANKMGGKIKEHPTLSTANMLADEPTKTLRKKGHSNRQGQGGRTQGSQSQSRPQVNRATSQSRSQNNDRKPSGDRPQRTGMRGPQIPGKVNRGPRLGGLMIEEHESDRPSRNQNQRHGNNFGRPQKEGGKQFGNRPPNKETRKQGNKSQGSRPHGNRNTRTPRRQK